MIRFANVIVYESRLSSFGLVVSLLTNLIEHQTIDKIDKGTTESDARTVLPTASIVALKTYRRNKRPNRVEYKVLLIDFPQYLCENWRKCAQLCKPVNDEPFR